MIFEYASDQRYQSELEINRIGNCAIQGLTYDAFEYYLIIKTDDYGVTTIKSFGPLAAGEPIIQELGSLVKPEMYFTINIMNYNEKSIYKFITNFLRKPKMKRQIASAIEIEIQEAEELLPDMRSIL